MSYDYAQVRAQEDIRDELKKQNTLLERIANACEQHWGIVHHDDPSR